MQCHPDLTKIMKLRHPTKVKSRLTGWIIAAAEGLVFLLPFSVLAYVPKAFFGALLLMIAIDLCAEWCVTIKFLHIYNFTHQKNYIKTLYKTLYSNFTVMYIVPSGTSLSSVTPRS